MHVALTNRRGGGKPHKRGLSVRKARKGRDYTALRDLGIRAVDEVFKMAAPLLREATDLRGNMQVRKTLLDTASTMSPFSLGSALVFFGPFPWYLELEM